MRQFLQLTNPNLILVARYDLWPIMIDEAFQQQIPVALVCGTMQRTSGRFNPFVRSLFRRAYEQLSVAMMVSSTDESALRTLAPAAHIRVCGDTRYDRVVDRAAARRELPLPSPPDSLPVLIVGSSWPQDERAVLDIVCGGRVRAMIVPHEPTERNLQSTERRVPGCTRLSKCGNRWPDGPVLVDSVGLLSALYGLGDIAWVGGGFGAGVHSVLEPAAYGIPVLCGPRIHRSRDAMDMRSAGLLTVVATRAKALRAIVDFVANTTLRMSVGAASRDFVVERAGATSRVIQTLAVESLVPVVQSLNAGGA